MRLSEREFWGLTLAQLNSLAERFASEQEMLNYRGALICSVIAEVNRNKKKRSRPYTFKDFMPKKRRGKLTGEEMLERIVAMNAALGGEAE